MMSSSNRSSLQGSKNVRYLFKCFYWLSNTAAVLLLKRKGNQFDIELLTTSIIAHWLAGEYAEFLTFHTTIQPSELTGSIKLEVSISMFHLSLDDDQKNSYCFQHVKQP